MLRKLAFAAVSLALVSLAHAQEKGFISLFDGKTLDNWKISGDPAAFKVEDGAIVTHGDCAHAFYAGKEKDAKFRNFELRLDVMTEKSANGGVYIHTSFQDGGWPAKGYEVQVNNTHPDWRKTGSLYSVVDNKEPFKDDEWMKYVVRVKDGKISITVNDKKLLVDYTPEQGKSKLQAEGGTIALQAHDKGSVVHYKNIRIQPLD
ncbi:MAG: hypothetical protein JWO82_742 [Akkermansiaceae bacterium]|nr:hypothetical protein [Akkermansiaceae bacterium]